MADSKTKSLVRSQFGAHAANYVNSRSHARGSSLARLVELAQPQRHWRALDVATGAGHTALAVAPHVADVVASDLTPEMLAVARDLARQRGISNVSFADAEAEDLPFQDQSFDLVTCRIAPHHFADVAKFVAEVARVLRPGGIFGLVDNISPDDAGAAAAYNALETLRDPSHGRCLTVNEWLALMQRSGLAVRHSELLDKEMEFEAWTTQQQVAAPLKHKLRTMFLESSGELKSFLRPQENGGVLNFMLTEAVIIAERPA